MTRESPFVGLNYFREEDADFFYGRETERKRLISNLRASRLTLLYAQSGVGKSSLLRAGVAADLNAAARCRSVRFVPVVVSTWHDDPMITTREALAAAAEPFAGPLTFSGDGIESAVQDAAEALGAKPLVILDQFEEFFLYHGGHDTGGRFADELARCVLRTDLSANFLLSIREDAYAHIGDVFKARIPNVYANYLHLDYLDERSARAAIRRPIEQFDRTVEIEPGLIDDVLAEVLIEAHGGGEPRYETALLQLVMQSVWDEEQRVGSTRLRRETLEGLGGGRTIIEAHLDSAMRTLTGGQQAAAADAFRFLVTPAGTKIAFSAQELAERVDTPHPELEPALEQLAGERIVRPFTASDEQRRYELFHDKLGEPVTEWRRRFQTAARERVRTRWLRLGGAIVGLLILLLVAAIVSLLNAHEQRERADAHALQANATEALTTDPEKSLWLAHEAVAKDADAEGVLRQAYSASRVRARIAATRTEFAVTSPGGQLLALAGPDAFQLWNPSTLRQIAVSHSPLDLQQVAVAEDGAAAAAVGLDGAVVLRATPSASPTWLDVPDAGVWNLALSADGRFAVASAGTRNWVWDATSGDVRIKHKLRRTDSEQYAYSFAFDPQDRNTIVAARCSRPPIIWHWRTGRTVTLRPPPSRPASDVPTGNGRCLTSVSPDGRRAITTDARADKHLWDLVHRRWLSHVPVARADDIVEVAWSADSRRAALAVREGAVIIDAGSGERVSAPMGNRDFTSSVAFDPSGETIVTSSGDRSAAVWDVRSGQRLAELRGHAEPVFAAVFVRGGREVVSASADRSVRRWSVFEGSVMRGHSDRVVAATVAPERGRIASAAVDGEALLWDLDDPGAAVRVRGAAQPPSDLAWIAFAANGRKIVTAGTRAGGEGQILIADATTGRVSAELPAYTHLQPVATARFSPNGANVVTASPYEWPWVFDASLRRFEGLALPDGVYANGAEYDRAGRRIVVAGTNGVAYLFDAGTKEPLRSFRHGALMLDARFSPDGTRLLTVGYDTNAKLWTVARPQEKPRVLSGHRARVSSGAFSPDGRSIATNSIDGTVRVWNADTGRLVSVETPHGGTAVNGVEFVDNRTLVSAGNDWNVRVFPCSTCFGRTTLMDEVRRRTFFTDQQRVALTRTD